MWLLPWNLTLIVHARIEFKVHLVVLLAVEQGEGRGVVGDDEGSDEATSP